MDAQKYGIVNMRSKIHISKHSCIVVFITYRNLSIYFKIAHKHVVKCYIIITFITSSNIMFHIASCVGSPTAVFVARLVENHF